MIGTRRIEHAFLMPLIILGLGSLFMMGCRNMLQQVGPVPIIITRDSFLIAWDAKGTDQPELPSAISHYNIYYRELYGKKWIFLNTTLKAGRTTTISVHELGGGSEYEIGVQQVFRNGRTSVIHGSTDFYAKPAGGWYVLLK